LDYEISLICIFHVKFKSLVARWTFTTAHSSNSPNYEKIQDNSTDRLNLEKLDLKK